VSQCVIVLITFNVVMLIIDSPAVQNKSIFSYLLTYAENVTPPAFAAAVRRAAAAPAVQESIDASYPPGP